MANENLTRRLCHWEWKNCALDTTFIMYKQDQTPNHAFYQETKKRCCINPENRDTQCVVLEKNYKGKFFEDDMTFYENGALKTQHTLSCVTQNEPHSEEFYSYSNIFDTLVCSPNKTIILQRKNFIRYHLPSGRVSERTFWVNDTFFYESYHYNSLLLSQKGQYIAKIDCSTKEYKKMGNWYFYTSLGDLYKEEFYP